LCVPAGALEDAEKALQELPGNPDLLYVKAYSFMLLDTGGSRRSKSRSSSSKAQQAQIEAENEMFEDYLRAAPTEHLKRPHAFYQMALLASSLALRAPSTKKEQQELKKAQELFEAGMEAEKQLPAFFLPVHCAAKDSLERMLPLLKEAPERRSDRVGPRSPGSGNRGGSHFRKSTIGAASSSRNGGVDTGKCSGCGCGGTGSPLMACAACKQVYYCSRACQVADWKAGHKAVCGRKE
jgi:hypothetical protein